MGDIPERSQQKWSVSTPVFNWIRRLWLPFGLPIVLYNTYKAWSYHAHKDFLRGKVVMLTGASSGIGEALAHEFYKHGCKLILCSRREEELDRVREELMRRHSVTEVTPPVVLPLDLSELNSLKAKADEALNVYGRVDILVNNGGMSYRGDIVSTHLAVDVKLMAVNYFGQVALCKALLPGMIAQGGGSIVVIGSVQGKIALPHRSCYAASKHALQAFCDSMRAETSSRNVFVTVVNPGYVRTGLSENAMTADGSKYGSMDSTTANGMSPDSVAKRTIKAIILREKEVTVSGIAPKAATWLRSVLPSLYFFIMEFRAGVRKQIDDDLAKTD
ncbi:unnamed protein product [Notodromas monacha]|uniref:Dehydrogenase/reductase SDR family protein 7-like n=1 Tax=Notodromas monacha TaxID=399045 RepID=A0A7R9C0N9_9CRUS|nr:unnamed protein product [Notodromas monacha]CAG0924019.1 unnamed protein product [Notodromas monacha]